MALDKNDTIVDLNLIVIEEPSTDKEQPVVKKEKKEYYKQWYKDNKEKHKSYLLEKISCECGKQVCRNSLHTHKKSSFHLKKMNNKKNENIEEVNNLLNIDTLVILKEIKKLENMLINLQNKT